MYRIVVYLAALVALVLCAEALGPRVQGQLPALIVTSVSCPASTGIVTGTETALVTSPGVSTQGARTVSLAGQVLATLATQTTAFTLRIRRGSGTGGANVITPTTVSATAQTSQGFAMAVDDAPGEIANQQYTLTAQQVGATVSGTAGSCQLLILAH